MLERTKLSVAVSAAFSAGLAVTAPSVSAQTQSLERVEVTGSLIRRIEGETALPVVTISMDDLKKAGVTNAEQAVKYITQQQGGQVTSGSVSGTNGGASFADLRSLGPSRTLVLLNGKRVVPNPFATEAVNLNSLPIAAVQRIETLPDGASATYGTDAIAGVINFITRREYQGIEVGADIQIPQESGGELYTGTLIGGWGSLAKQGWNVYGSLNYRKQEPLGGLERDFMQTSYLPGRGYNALSPTTFPANYNQTGTVTNTNPSLPGCFPPSSILAADPLVGLGTNRCGADTQTFTYVVPNQEQWSTFLRGSLAVGSNHTAYLEYFFSRNDLTTRIAPSPEGGLTMPPTSPFYPGNGITPITDPALNTTLPISIAWRTTALGSRVGNQENDTQRVVAGFEGSGLGWDYQASLLWSEADVTNDFLNGYPSTLPLRAGVAGTGGAPFLNPFGSQTPAGLAYLESIELNGRVQNGKGELRNASGVISRQFGQLPGGPVSVALLAEFREEEMKYETNLAIAASAASSGLAGSGALREGDRNVKALAAEAILPLAKGLEMGLGVRWDDYSDFGSTLNPKVTLRYTPIEQLLLRGSYNTGFTAPTLYNLYLPNSTTFTANRFNDPVLCPGGVPAPGSVPSRDCGIQFQQQLGGNQNLTAEESNAYSLGFVLQPIPSFNFSLDYWHYKLRETIGTIGEQTIFGAPAQYANLFVRCSQASAAQQLAIGACQNPGAVDPLAFIINTFQNLGETETDGFDFQANWQGDATRYGRFSVGLRGTYVRSYDFQVVKGGQFFDPVGNYSPQFAGPVIRLQTITNLGWQQNVWSANLFHRYLSGYVDQNAGVPAQHFNRVQDYSVFDLSVAYTGIRNVTLRAGILNLLDEDPPFTNQVGRFQARGYDDRFHNPLGRVFTLGASYQF